MHGFCQDLSLSTAFLLADFQNQTFNIGDPNIKNFGS